MAVEISLELEEVNMNQHQFEAIINAIDEPAILINRDYQIVAANAAHTERYDPKPKGRTCYEVSHGYTVPCDQAGETCPLRECLESKQRERVLHIHNTAQGKEHVDVELTPVPEEDTDEVAFFVEVMRTAVPAAKHGQTLLGYSSSFTRMLELLKRAAPSKINVLLQGESGTGKELAAQYLHNESTRSDKPFVIVECSGLSESLFESELFGHEKGAFTGAINHKIGLVETANKGTLFLDEVGDIPLSMQVKLLRLIETGTFRSVGSVSEKKADFRLICASHKNLESMVAEGTFRQDLYFRISPYPVYLPSLAERRDDIALLANSMVKDLDNTNTKHLGDKALQWLERQEYPGNIRQLRNVIERALLLCDGEEIKERHVRIDHSANAGSQPKNMHAEHHDKALKTIAEVERDYLLSAIKRHPNDNKSLAKILGLSERTLYRKLNQLEQNN